jgi:ribose transport system permease protein
MTSSEPQAPDLGADAAPRFSARALSPHVGRSLDRILDAGIVISLGILVLVFTLLSPYFLTVANVKNIFEASAITGVVAVGMTMGLIAGQFDLSVGSVVGFTSSALAVLMTNQGVPVGWAIVLAIGAALLFGVFNAFLVVTMNINSIIATLGTLTAIRGIAFIITSGKPIVTSDGFLNALGVDRFAGLAWSVWIMLLAYAVGYVILHHTRLGIHVYAVGGNPVAAERAGLSVGRLTFFVFLASAFTAAIGGILITARSFSGQAVFGQDMELDVLTAILLGGVGLRGGQGTLGKTLIGVIIVGVINNGLVLTQVPGFYTDVVRGAALVVAVVLEAVRERRALR